MTAFFTLLRRFMGIKTHLSNSSSLSKLHSLPKGKTDQGVLLFFPVAFGPFLGLADIMLSQCLITCSMTFAVLGKVTSHLLDGNSIRVRAADSTSYKPTEQCQTIQKAHVSVIDFTEDGGEQLYA